MTLPHDVALFLAVRLRSSVRELEGAINRLDAFSRISRRVIDVELARTVLGPAAESGGHRYDVDAVMRATSHHFSVKIPDLKGNRRHRHVTTARMIAMYLVRKHNETSYPELGRAFGGRDHSTAINACRRVAEWMLSNDRIAADVAAIEASLGR
jgi:chromosomal replication initiator protein